MKPYYYVKILGIIKNNSHLRFLKACLQYGPRVNPINRRHTEPMRQSYVLYLCKNSFRRGFKCARTQSSSRCTFSLISGKLLPTTRSRYTDHIITSRGHFALYGIHRVDSCCHCHQNNVVNILSSFRAAWLIFPLRGFIWDFLCSFPNSAFH